jgi:RES domain-containing protein
LRFRGTCYRAHDPRWSHLPLSGAGAAIHGGRFNPKGVEALYLSLSVLTAVKEANQGFAFKIIPCVLCSYEIDCEDIADLRSEQARSVHGVTLADMACAWFGDASAGRQPPSWNVARQMMATGHAGMLVPSFAPGASDEDENLVLWSWSAHTPHQVNVHDPSGRLPKNQLSWE